MSAQSEIEKVLAAIETAWHAGDGTGFASVFIPDADFATWFGIRLQGREAIAASHDRIFDTIYRNTDLHLKLSYWRPVTEEVVVVHTEGWVTPQGGQPEGEAEVRPLLVMVRAGQGWQVAVFQNTPVLDPSKTGGDIRRMQQALAQMAA